MPRRKYPNKIYIEKCNDCPFLRKNPEHCWLHTNTPMPLRKSSSKAKFCIVERIEIFDKKEPDAI